jgi:NAD(P)-dependent dehydrogenase (short-subunit alcohol dehydrogenase family)
VPGTFADPARRAWIESKIKLGRLGELDDIMGAVVFLASDAAAMIHRDQSLDRWRLDGGLDEVHLKSMTEPVR